MRLTNHDPISTYEKMSPSQIQLMLINRLASQALPESSGTHSRILTIHSFTYIHTRAH